MEANWNIYDIASMGIEKRLRNTCRQFEQEYVDWGRSMTYDGHGISQRLRELDGFGKTLLSFVTNRNRSMVVVDQNGVKSESVKAMKGMAEKLYLIAGSILDRNDLTI